jgi:hypothetical protein
VRDELGRAESASRLGIGVKEPPQLVGDDRGVAALVLGGRLHPGSTRRGMSGPYGPCYSIEREDEDLDAIVTDTGAQYVFGAP